MKNVGSFQDPTAISLPYQDEIFPGESGQGYALRMCARNGLPSLNCLKQLLGKSHSMSLEARDAPCLAHWFGGSVQRVAFALEQVPSGKRAQGTRYAGHELGRSYFLNRSFPRVCPQCITEYGYCRMAWDLSLCVACIRHRRLLIEVCPVCGFALSWGRPDMDRCACGYPWSSCLCQPQEPTADELWIAHALELQLPDGDAVENDPGLCPDWGCLIRRLSLDGAMRIVFALATAAAYEGPQVLVQRKRGSIWKARQMIAAAAEFGNKLARLESIYLRPHRPSVLMDLLCDLSASETATADDMSTAQSMLQWLLRHSPRSKLGSRHPSRAQQVLF